MIASAKKQGFTSPVLTNTAGNAKWTEGNAFAGVQSSFYWSSSSIAFTPSDAWYVNLGVGLVDHTDKGFVIFVWPVRGGQ